MHFHGLKIIFASKDLCMQPCKLLKLKALPLPFSTRCFYVNFTEYLLDCFKEALYKVFSGFD
jgi:hypothetical protein